MNVMPTTEEYFKTEFEIWTQEYPELKTATKRKLIEFVTLHVNSIKELQQCKYYAGETGYIKNEEWEEIINNIK